MKMKWMRSILNAAHAVAVSFARFVVYSALASYTKRAACYRTCQAIWKLLAVKWSAVNTSHRRTQNRRIRIFFLCLFTRS